MLEDMKEKVCQANRLLPNLGLARLTWGNVSAIKRDRGLIVIKPSGVEYSTMQPGQMVVVDLDGRVIEGTYRPSSDLASHLELYRQFEDLGGVVHTHSRYATAFAQAERSIPCYGTTHADNFHGSIPCTRPLTSQEIQEDYELNTARVIVETFKQGGWRPLDIPAVVVCKHGPFTWGLDVDLAVENAVVLEEVAHLALLSEQLSPEISSAPQNLVDKHYQRKHGPTAYYGQNS
jgi:L-ribulose-5-phosphate 4-epimerase